MLTITTNSGKVAQIILKHLMSVEYDPKTATVVFWMRDSHKYVLDKVTETEWGEMRRKMENLNFAI